MSFRVQVILEQEDVARFNSRARKESKSLSAWLRDAGRKMLEDSRESQALTDAKSLKEFFQKCNDRECGAEPEWEELKRLIIEGFQSETNV